MKRKRRNHWSAQRLTELAGLAQTMTHIELAKRYKITSAAIKNLCAKHGIQIRVSPFRRRWTEQEVEYLKANIGEKSLKQIAKHLKRTYHSVNGYVKAHGISDAWRERTSYLMTANEVAEMLGVQTDTVRQWAQNHGLPYEIQLKYGRYLESEVIAWLRQGHALRLDRATAAPHIQRIYDAVRREYYTGAELYAMNIPALTPQRFAVVRCRGKGPDIDTTPIVVGNASNAMLNCWRIHYYRRDAVLAWAWHYGQTIYEEPRHPDIADVMTAWRTHYVTRYDLNEVIGEDALEYWYRRYDFPRAVRRGVYDRRAVVAWLKVRGHAREAHRLDRGGVLCYHDLIRDREARHA